MSRGPAADVLYLLGKTLLELLLLPFHLAWFLCRRTAIRREIREILERRR